MSALTLNSHSYIKQVDDSVKKSIKEKLNIMAYPRLEKISINVGVGKFDNKQKLEIVDYLTKLTAQLPRQVKSNKSISGFGLRSGNVVGVQLTLRGKKMYDFLMNLVFTALPRSRDFKGVQPSFDYTGKTLSIGISNSQIFPVIGFDSELIFGMQVNIVFKQNSPYNKLWLEEYKFPFTK